jgi:hypothetical protein
VRQKLYSLHFQNQFNTCLNALKTPTILKDVVSVVSVNNAAFVFFGVSRRYVQLVSTIDIFNNF